MIGRASGKQGAVLDTGLWKAPPAEVNHQSGMPNVRSRTKQMQKLYIYNAIIFGYLSPMFYQLKSVFLATPFVYLVVFSDKTALSDVQDAGFQTYS